MKLKQDLISYHPYNEQEEKDRSVMLHLLDTQPDIFLRENQAAHFTASSWLVNRQRDKVLLIYHNLYDSWAWTGGHADGDKNLLRVAIKEAGEETGLTGIAAVSEDIFSIETLTVNGHRKRGVYVPSHLHLNVTYLLEADEKAALRMKPDENKGVKWFSLEDAVNASSEPWMAAHIYKKLNEKLIKLIKQGGVQL
jgi:8-oxo-dGTP pyrophosphatase MutT (NUDIX family)